MRGTWLLPDAEVTQRLGAALGRHCPWSSTEARCLFLSGELGAGKTTLAAALIGALGVSETVRSPTYALIEIYAMHVGLVVHLDLYRLRGASELEQLGVRDYLQPNTLLVIEWPEHALSALPAPDLALSLVLKGQGRECTIEAPSVGGEGWLAAVQNELPPSETI